MNLQLKQRLVGAVVLISLAVILVPMLLDGNERRRMLNDGSNMPVPPDYEFEALEIPLRLPDSQEKAEREATHPVPETSKQTGKSEAEPPAESTAVPKSSPTRIERKPLVSGTTTVEAPAKTEQKPKPQPKSVVTTDKTTEKAATATSDKDREPWVVQLGSFSSIDNARALRDKLKKMGFSAYVEKHKSDNGASYRVRVGPVAGRDKAEALRDQIENKSKIKGMPMPRSS